MRHHHRSLPSKPRPSARMRAIHEAPLCDVCRSYAWHGADQWPIRGHHPACPTLTRNPWTDTAGADTDAGAGAGAVSRLRVPGEVNGQRTQGEIKLYMRRLDEAYKALHAAIVARMQSPPATSQAWVFINDWHVLFGRWNAFFEATIEDWIITSEEDGTATDYGTKLERARSEYERVFRARAPGDPVRPPAATSEPSSPLTDAVGILKWGVIGYLAIHVVNALRSK